LAQRIQQDGGSVHLSSRGVRFAEPIGNRTG
jgi:hypothetical protein